MYTSYTSHRNGFKPTEDLKSNEFDLAQETARHLLSVTSHRPVIAIICGSGLGNLVDTLENTCVIAYDQIPHFAVSTAPGHAGKLVFGELRGKSCVCMQGRIHLYEGYPAWKTAFPVRVFNAMGVKVLLATNAAGALNPEYRVGDFMIFKSHINLPGLVGMNPLIGPHDDRLGARFPALSNAYDVELRGLAKQAAKQLGYDFLHEGVYVMVSGPCYETVAEGKMLRVLGADVTGMSTVPEVMVGHQGGLRCFAMTLVTNAVTMNFGSNHVVDSDHVLKMGSKRSEDCQRLIAELVALIDL